MKKGFTLIELLIVVAIIGILAAIAVPNFMNAQIRAKIARVQSDLKAMVTALEMYRTDNNGYPDSCSLETMGDVNFRAGEIWAPVAYSSIAPIDPFNTTEGSRNSTFAAKEYFYINKGPCAWFDAGIDLAVQRATNAPKNPAYILASQGPDNLSELQAANPNYALEYDASNGLVSI
ncbi:MAG: prepilin-type N-terminal cleavage/methylation domain-containing protein, partial [bacterium]|nr:prepilin-type N-terminal cleavage/methylation domain-containing protein [bacterium]